MPKEVKFSEEELNQVKDIQSSYLNIQNRFGQVHVIRLRLQEQLSNLEKGQEEIDKEYKKLQEKESSFLSEVTKKYGEGSLNPETGVFTSNKSEE